MKMCSPEGSIRGPRQLAQPGARIAQTVANNAQSEVRHFQRNAMLVTIHARRGGSTRRETGGNLLNSTA